MKNILFYTSLIFILVSCKKEKQNTIDKNITINHIFQLSEPTHDTLFAAYIPSAFSPNGDGVNDNFYPKMHIGEITGMKIYSNSGQIVFDDTNKYFAWNGRINNSKQIASISTYTYKLEVKDIYGTVYKYTGTVLLLR